MLKQDGMKKIFYLGLAGLALFEILNVYFIMPMPGSQRIASLDVAYFLYSYRWGFRLVCLGAIVAGYRAGFQSGPKWRPALATLAASAVIWFFNFVMTADHMFLPPGKVVLKYRADNRVDESSVVVGIEQNGEARAYPVRYLVYHHQVQDTVGGRPVIVTYCSVCRTGRVYEPLVNGQPEKFRLVGMDHFNAMFEDASTGSWWRQATGEAVTGSRKGAALPEVASSQLTLGKWFQLHPGALVMQPDDVAAEEYDVEGRFERGKSKGDLTRTDPGSWQEKSWVVGVQLGGVSKAYDWNRLKRQRILNDRVGDAAVVLVLAVDQKSFAVFERPDPAEIFTVDRDIISCRGRSYDLSGRDLTAPDRRLKPVKAYQEFWHSWRTFHPGTKQYPE